MYKNINFITIGDKNYFKTINSSAKQINKIYPPAKVFIYDWGFTKKQLESLKKNKNTQIINWEINRKKIIDSNYAKNWRFYIRKYVFRRDPKKLDLNRLKEYLLCEKVKCMLDCSKRINENLIFLDGDAFLINKIDEIFKQDFDIGVTLRRISELKWGGIFGTCNILNSGVIFFKTSREKMKLFIEAWIKKMNRTTANLSEQTSLTYLIQKSNKGIYNSYYKTGVLKIKNKKIKTKVFPCEIYNYNWIEEGVDKKKVKILHLKSGRYAKENFKKIIKRLKL